jgi:hypothetical protein
MEKKQTAVDLLVSILNKEGFTPVLTNEEIQHFKQMEKEQMIEAHGIKESHGAEGSRNFWQQTTGEQYYNETYGGNNSEITMNNQSSTFPYVCTSCKKEMVAGGFPKWFCLHTTCKNYLKPITK